VDADEGSLQAFFQEEVRWAARDLGLSGYRLGSEGLSFDLAGGRR
jgi:hypothetical protein